jgi:hypothetical protein
MKKSGKTPRQEAEEILDKYNLTGSRFSVRKILFRYGFSLSAHRKYSKYVMVFIYLLIIINAYLKRNPRRWDIDTLLSACMKSPFSSPAP